MVLFYYTNNKKSITQNEVKCKDQKCTPLITEYIIYFTKKSISKYSKPSVKVALLLWIQEIDLGFAKVAPVLQKKKIYNKSNDL